MIVPEGESFVIHPGEFCLGRTLEWVELPDDIVARIEGKSSLGRLGLIVHATAGFCDPGWKGTLTLELNNLTRIPIKLYPGLEIAQLSFMILDRPALRPYGSPELGSHYQGQRAATASRYRGGAGQNPSRSDRLAPCWPSLSPPPSPPRHRSTSPEACVAVWAVVLAGLGLTQPEFPFGARGQRGVIAFSFVLVVIAIAAAILTDPEPRRRRARWPRGVPADPIGRLRVESERVLERPYRSPCGARRPGQPATGAP